MKGCTLIAILLALTLAGCALRHTESDDDARRFADAWETPWLEQQPVLFSFAAEGELDDPAAAQRDALDTLLDSAKFRIATTEDEPAYTIAMTVRVHRDTHTLKAVGGALLLCLWPADVQDYFCEVFAVVRKPSGTLVGRCYAQGRGKVELWLPGVLRGLSAGNRTQAEVIRRDTLKAAAVKICRLLMPPPER